MSAACLSDLVLSARTQKISRRAHWLSEPDLRQHSHAGLNKGEASNSVRRAVFFRRQGEIRDRTFENQSFRASGLSLIPREADDREFPLPPLLADEAVDGYRAGSDDAVLFERRDLGGRQPQPIAVDLAVMLAEFRAGHGVDRVGAVDT